MSISISVEEGEGVRGRGRRDNGRIFSLSNTFLSPRARWALLNNTATDPPSSSLDAESEFESDEAESGLIKFATSVRATSPPVCETETEVVLEMEDAKDVVVGEPVEVAEAVDLVDVVAGDEEDEGATARGRVEGITLRVLEVVLVLETIDEVEAN